ncbi:MAG: hypothetical protein L0154_14495 [Chloroflexi bacterium]|nr:hypothetical protein [Chloroflexota bacterium]
MPAKIFWLHYERVVYIKIEGILTLEQLRDANLFNVQLLNGTRHNLPVYFIADSLDMIRSPQSIFGVQSAAEPLVTHPKFGCMVDVHNKSMVWTVSFIISKLFGTCWQGVATLAAALEFLEGMDTSLGILPHEIPDGEALATVL